MSSLLTGIHHVTALAADPAENHAFYTHTLGQRLVKKTVNFDDPYTYHFYYGDPAGSPGTILTFFPWENIPRGRNGAGGAVFPLREGANELRLEIWGRSWLGRRYYREVIERVIEVRPLSHLERA